MTLYKLYLVCVLMCATTVHAMKLNRADSNKILDQAVSVLPELTLVEKWVPSEYIDWSGNKTTNFGSAHELDTDRLYKQCFSESDPLKALSIIAQPRTFTWNKHVNGQPVTQQRMLQFPLAHLARGFLLLKQNNQEEAREAFLKAQTTTHAYRVHEEPIACAARFELLLADKNFDEAYQVLARLKDLSKIYSSFKALSIIQEEQLMDAKYAPLVDANRCAEVKQLLTSNNKSQKAQGLKQCQALISDYLKSTDTAFKNRVEFSGVLDSLSELAYKGYPAASLLEVQLIYEKMFERTLASDDVQLIDQCKTILKLCAHGKALTDQDAQLIGKFQAYAAAILAYHSGEYAKAFSEFIELVNSRSKNNVIIKLRDSAQQYITQLSLHGNFDARCYLLSQNVKECTAKNIPAHTIAECNLLLSLALVVQYPTIHPTTIQTLLNVSMQLAEAGDAEISYLVSQLLFRQAHASCKKTGLSSGGLDSLLPVFKCAARARTVVPQAALFTQAVMNYRGALGMLAAGKNDEAVELLITLLDFKGILEPEQRQCSAFARFQLDRLANSGVSLACKWQIAEHIQIPSKRSKAMTTVQSFLEQLTALDFSSKNLLTAKKTLAEYVRFNVFNEIEQLCVSQPLNLDAREQRYTYDGNTRAQAHYIVSLTRRLEHMLGISLLQDSVTSTHELLLLAIEQGKKACALSTNIASADLYRMFLGNLYCALGTHYLECMSTAKVDENYVAKCIDSFSQGVRLQNPSCMRALAGTMLEQRSLEDGLFHEYVNMLEDAYKLGDKAAGAILAEHYFEGKAVPFGCGQSLKKDIQKAARYAREVGPEYPQTKRLCAYLEFCRVRELYKEKKAQRPDIAPIVQELMDAALANQDKAYEHLAEISMSSLATGNIAAWIAQFLELRAERGWPAAYCALGSILLMDTANRHVVIAQGYFQKAIELSDGWLGHFEMAYVHTQFTHDVLQAAEHALIMLKQDAAFNRIDANHATVVNQVLSKLFNYVGDYDSCIKVEMYKKEISALLDRLGIRIQISEKLFDTETLEEVVSCEKELTHDMVVSGKCITLKEMSDELVKEFSANPKAIESFKKSASKGNPFGHYVLSKIYAFKAHALHEVTPHSAEEFELYSEAILHATGASSSKKATAEYHHQFVRIYKKMFEYILYSLEHLEPNPQDLDHIFGLVKQGMACSLLPEMTAFQVTQEFKQVGHQCLALLAQKKYAPAITLLASQSLKN